MKKDFKAIDDYLQHLFDGDKSYAQYGNDIKAFIPKYFKPKENDDEENHLIFCLVEKVNLGEINAIGETYIYSPFSDGDVNDQIIDSYKKIIKKVQSKFNGGITQYEDWYRRNMYIFIHSNDGADKIFKASRWRRDGKPQSDNRDKKDYCSEKKPLEEKLILEYLEFYAQQLHDDEFIKLKQYPHYTIIVRPISVELDDSVFPLGNLYLHFATKEAKNEAFYCRFINDFLTVWFKNSGSVLIKKIQKDAVKNKQSKELKNYLPRLTSSGGNRLTKKIKPTDHTPEDYYKYLFENETNIIELKHQRDKVINSFIPILLSEKNIMPNKSSNQLDDWEDYLCGKNLNSLSSPEDDIKKFIEIIIRRNITHLCILFFNYTIQQVHSLLISGSFFDIQSNRGKSLYAYFWSNLLISLDEKGHEEKKIGDKTKKKILASMSEEEKIFLKDCLQSIKEKLNPSQLTIFNTLSYQQISKI